MIIDIIGKNKNEKWDIKKQVYFIYIFNTLTQKFIYFPHVSEKKTP